jgi:hypothetical protein
MRDEQTLVMLGASVYASFRLLAFSGAFPCSGTCMHAAGCHGPLVLYALHHEDVE